MQESESANIQKKVRMREYVQNWSWEHVQSENMIEKWKWDNLQESKSENIV